MDGLGHPRMPPKFGRIKSSSPPITEWKAPLAKRLKDVRGWGSKSGNYTVAEGYKSIKAIPHVPRNPAIWNYIWGTKTLPKVD